MNFIFDDLTKYHIDIRDYLPNLEFSSLTSKYIEESENTGLKRCLSKDKEVLYIGQVRNGMRNGFGSEFYPKAQGGSTLKVKGFFFDDKIDGEPVHIYSSKGDLTFVGIYEDNQPASGI